MLHTYEAHPRMSPIGEFPVERLMGELDAHPELWNEHRFRTESPKSPHREADDIWARYNALENFGPEFNDEHESVWYPCAEKLPNLKPLVECVAHAMGARTVGGVLITRVPAGKQIYWHADSGWHAGAHRKFLVLLRGYHGQSFEFENQYSHRVLNDSDSERISLIICLRDFA